MRPTTRAGLQLLPGGQFVVFEAKMKSRLAAGTKYAPFYDQAVRNVAAMAWTIQSSGLLPSDLQEVAFLVIAPTSQLEREPTFAAYCDPESMKRKFAQRVALYEGNDPARHSGLRLFQETFFEPLLEVGNICPVSWEETIDTLAPSAQSLQAFYDMCLRLNYV